MAATPVPNGGLTAQFIDSGAILSGSIGSGSVQGFFGTVRNIASGTIGVTDFGSGAVVAGTVGSGAIQSGNIASGQVGRNAIASGAINSGLVASGAVMGQLGGGAFNIASGSIGANDLSSGAVTSGGLQAGAVSRPKLASGTNAYGEEHTLITGELISGLKAVALAPDASLNPFVVRAERQSGLRLPAIGVTVSGNVSGAACTVVTRGFIAAGVSGMIASGRIGRMLYVGSGGLIVNSSGFADGASSGAAFISGSVAQIIGVFNTGGSGLNPGIYVNPDFRILSGLTPTAQGEF